MPLLVVNAEVVYDKTGNVVQIPVLLTPEGPLVPLIDYCLAKRRSLSWMEKLLRSVKLFLEYLEANAVAYEEEWRLFRNFAMTLHNGSINLKTREDPSGLYWAPYTGQGFNHVISLLSDFFDWLGADDSGNRVRALKFNPRYVGGEYENRIDLKAYEYRRSKAFLQHTWLENPSETRGRMTRGAQIPKVQPKRPPEFPAEKFEELLFKGFRVAGRYDYRGMLITLLLYGGGLRSCEPFHAYLADVQPHWDDPSVAFVAIHHPELGTAPNRWRNAEGQRGTRQQYLASEFGLIPRNKVRGHLSAGWKHPALDDHWYMQVHWFPETYGRWFMQIWGRYLEQVASIDRHHPYAFINLERQPIGEMYAIGSYYKALEAAVERIGLVFGKKYGTTSHGPRHAYAQRARRTGIDQAILQRIMHHSSPLSQEVYTQPARNEIRSALAQAASCLTEQVSGDTSILLPNSELRLD